VSISKERDPAVPAVTAGSGRASPGAGRLRPWWVGAASVAALLVVLCVRNRFLFTTRLYEDADMGANSILIEQARHFTLLVGNYSRDHFHHPGPAYMYVQAAGESLFWAFAHVVPTPWNGQLLAAYALNATFLSLVVGMVFGWTRSLRGAAACFAVLAAFASAHPAMLSTDWMPYLYVPTYIAFVVAAASVAAGRTRHAWIMALTGWFLIHGHACFLFFVPVISLVVLAAVLWPRRRRFRASVRSFFATQRRVWVPVAVISAVFALPIVLDLALHWPGQFGDYLKYSSSSTAGGHSVSAVVRDVLWYWWPFRNAWFPIAGYAIAAAVTGWLAPARLRRFLGALLAVNAVSSLAFGYYAATGIDVLSEHYIGYFYWSAPVITLLVIAVGVVEAMPSQWHLGAVAAIGAAALALAALAMAPHTRTSTDSSDPAVLSSGPDTDPALPGAVSALAARSGGRMIVVRFRNRSWPDVTGFLVLAERQGIRACTANRWTFMMTSQFICTNQEIANGRVFWFTPAAPRGSEVIARLRQAVVTAATGSPPVG
jgi:hypothetical protein